MLTLDAFCRTLNLHPCWFMGKTIRNGECGQLDAGLRSTIVELYRQSYAIVAAKAADAGLTLHDEPVLFTTRSPYLRVNKLVRYAKRVRSTVTATISSAVDICNDVVTLTATVPALDTCETLRSARVVWGEYDSRLGVEWTEAPTISGTTFTAKARAYNFIDFDDVNTLLESVAIEYDVERPAAPVAVYAAVPCGSLAAPTDDCESSEVSNPTRKSALTYTDSHVVQFIPLEHCAGAVAWYETDAVSLGMWDASFTGAFVSVINTSLPANYCACSPIANERWRYDNGITDDPTKTVLLGGYTPFGTMKPGAHAAWKIFAERINAPLIY